MGTLRGKLEQLRGRIEWGIIRMIICTFAEERGGHIHGLTPWNHTSNREWSCDDTLTPDCHTLMPLTYRCT